MTDFVFTQVVFSLSQKTTTILLKNAEKLRICNACVQPRNDFSSPHHHYDAVLQQFILSLNFLFFPTGAVLRLYSW